MVVDPQGQKAVTDYRVLGTAGGMAWLELRPRTGRTHQIRVHCAALGTPIVGDPTYGGAADHKLQLHARAIALPLYPAKPPVAVTAPVPPHMVALLAGARLAREPGRFGAECGSVSEAGITIRRLSPQDAALFRDIRLEGLRRDPDAFSSIFEDESGKELSFFAERLDRSAVFGAFRGAELLGVAGFYVQPGPKHRHKGTLWGMYVRPQARGAGIAGRLVEAVVEHARAHVELLQLTVISENLAARRLYERFGFAAYGLEKRAAKYRGRYHDDLLMAKILTPDGEPDSGPPSRERKE